MILSNMSSANHHPPSSSSRLSFPRISKASTNPLVYIESPGSKAGDRNDDDYDDIEPYSPTWKSDSDMQVEFESVQRWCAVTYEPFPIKKELSYEDAAMFTTSVQLAHVIPNCTKTGEVS